ncbi:hypothetical protein Ple7327_1346 [Pleurocapsa sp. PCC 7327]|nr:hypothetical protein [Pleurocapsa sp. PCC 7327]AFY76735.1 hypothetical protein Ple7327_1346 [Pleurocapsa sp. PCC 7327]
MANEQTTSKRLPTQGSQLSQDWSAVLTALALLVLVLLGINVPW